jgi:hypothetical protein
VAFFFLVERRLHQQEDERDAEREQANAGILADAVARDATNSAARPMTAAAADMIQVLMFFTPLRIANRSGRGRTCSGGN